MRSVFGSGVAERPHRLAPSASASMWAPCNCVPGRLRRGKLGHSCLARTWVLAFGVDGGAGAGHVVVRPLEAGPDGLQRGEKRERGTVDLSALRVPFVC